MVEYFFDKKYQFYCIANKYQLISTEAKNYIPSNCTYIYILQRVLYGRVCEWNVRFNGMCLEQTL